MKKSFIFALCSLSMVMLLLFSGCKNKEQDPETFVSDKTRPVWTAPEQCLGVAQLQEGYFFIYINSPAESSSQVTLRYYSAFYKNLFEAKDAFPFKNDDILGTIADPYIPALVVVE